LHRATHALRIRGLARIPSYVAQLSAKAKQKILDSIHGMAVEIGFDIDRVQLREIIQVQEVGRNRDVEKVRILFLAANPTGTTPTPLKLDEESREIDKKIRASDHRDSLELITRWAVRPDDLLQYLNQFKPHVVHFSGHGSSTEEITLLDDAGKPKSVSKEALVSLFRTLRDNIRVVLLNACYSQP
jgi:hypothetical protein